MWIDIRITKTDCFKYKDVTLIFNYDIFTNSSIAQQGPRIMRGEGALCVEMGFYVDIFWESKCNIEINAWAQFYKILLVFEVPYQPLVKGMPVKS